MRVCLARPGTPACGSAHRRCASCWTISWRRLPWRAHQPVALRTRSLPVQQERCREVRSVKQGHGRSSPRNCAARLNSPQSMAPSWHQAFRGCVCPSGKWRGSAAGREAMLVAAAAQFDSILRGVRRRPDHTIHSQHARWLAHIHRDGSRLGSVEANSRPGCSPRRWRACTLTLGAGGACPSDSNPAAAPPATVAGRETAPVRSQTHGMLGRQSFASADGALPLVPSACAIQVGPINALSCSGDQVLGAGSGARRLLSRLIKQKGTC